MIEFGKTLREAREAKGYSVSQLAEMTHILAQIIENLEREDFTKIVAPIYGRGFVKLYCEHVGLEPKPLIDEFMAIYNGERPPVIRMKDAEPSASEEAPVPANEPPQADEGAPAPAPLDEPPPVAREPLSRPVPPAAPFAPGPDDLPFPEEKPAATRDYRLPGYAISDVPRSYWRFGILAVAAIAIVVLLVIGSRALYRATMNAPAESGAAEQCVSGEVAGAETAPSAKRQAPGAKVTRKPIAVPPLYID